MKKLVFAFTILSFTAVFAQKVSDYKYISLPEKLEGFKDSNYGLDKALTNSLKAKKYILLPDNRAGWPAGANQYPCEVLSVDVLNDSGIFRNKVILLFKDCNSKVMMSQKGSSSIKEFEAGFQDALKQALKEVPVSDAKEISNIPVPPAFGTITSSGNKINEVATLEAVKDDTIQKASKVTAEKASNSFSKADKYDNGVISLQKVQIAKDQFILLEDNSSVPYATFKETTKKDVFRVTMKSGDATIGYIENGSIVIEIPMGNDRYFKEVFSL